MPRCNSCGKNYDNPNALELVKNQDNRWLMLCRQCRDLGVDVNLVEKPNTVVEEHALATAETSAINTAPSGDPIADARRLLDSLRSLRQSKERVGRARSHQRKPVEMKVYFTLARDDTRHEGTVRDFSQGGLRLITDYHLVKGQIVQFDWNMPLPPAMAKTLQNTAEVRRIVTSDDGTHDVGFRFLTRQVDKGANRRRFRRYKCDMVMYYQRNGSAIMSRGRVSDISQGGCQVHLEEALDSSELFQVRLIGGGGTKGDLVGSMRVCRVTPKEVEFVTGCSFEKMRMEKQADPTETR